MKILHIGDNSGIASITANMCSRLGHPSVVLTDSSDDIWDHGDYYDNTASCKSSSTLMQVIRQTVDKYDHIVYHNKFAVAAQLDDLHIPSSFMFHGNVLRQEPNLYYHVDSLESIDNLFVTTGDQLKYASTAELFRRPVDLDLFVMDHKSERTDIGMCLTQRCYMNEVKAITDMEENVILVADRAENMRSYQDMPEFLNNLKYYYDIKFQPTQPPMVIPELSQTGLEALACGVAVWSNGIWFTKFPDVHSDEWTCKEFISVLLE